MLDPTLYMDSVFCSVMASGKYKGKQGVDGQDISAGAINRPIDYADVRQKLDALRAQDSAFLARVAEQINNH